MINELIKELAYDKISLSQALTRAKLIARQVKNDSFTNWLNKELNGYDKEDPLLPTYRIIFSEIKLTAHFPFGRTQSFPVIVDNDDKGVDRHLNWLEVIEPISLIEVNMEQLTGEKGVIPLTGSQLQILRSFYQKQLLERNGVITSGSRTVGKVQFRSIIELTKQKLIDTLQDLGDQFPDIDNRYVMSEENDQVVNNIVNNNIYGNNNPLNVAAGNNIKQGDITTTINQIDWQTLKKFGIEDSEIEELKIIDKELPKGDSTRTGKFMGWLAKVTASMTARGLYENIPAVVEYFKNFV